MPDAAIPQPVAAVIGQTFLAKLPAAVTARVLEGGYRMDLDAGTTFGRPSSAAGIVLEGLIRVFLESPDGRQVTVRYARPGDTLGLVHLFGGVTAVVAQAVTRASVWVIAGSRLREASAESAPLAVAIAEECAVRTFDAMDELGLIAFGSVRQRVARHLLDLAEQHDGGELVAPVTQQQLADACGSVREVVARVLRDLRAAGMVGGAEGGVGIGIVILDAAALDVEATDRRRTQ